LINMVYLKLMSFLRDTFGGRAKDIAQEAMEHAGIIDIDQASKIDKKKFADHILRNNLNFSPQRNRYLYDSLLKSLEIADLFDIKQFREAEKEVKKDENIVLTSFQSYWHGIEHAFSKYEVILNLFWLKGVEAELHGTDKEYVDGIMGNALHAVRKDMDEAYRQLMEDLDLNRYMKREHHDAFRIRIFKDPGFQPQEDAADPDTRFLLECIETVRNRVNDAHERIRQALTNTLQKEFRLRSDGSSDEQLIYNLKGLILAEYRSLNEISVRKYKEMENKFI
jgi:hypothetical protein